MALWNRSISARNSGSRVDVPLDEVGLAEAARLGALFEPVPLTVVVCSPLLRARQTAAPITSSTGAAVLIQEAFNDRDVGGWSGKPAAQVAERFGGLDHAPGSSRAATWIAGCWPAGRG